MVYKNEADNKKWRDNNKEKISSYQKSYYPRNRVKKKEYTTEYQKVNRVRVNELARIRYHKRKEAKRLEDLEIEKTIRIIE